MTRTVLPKISIFFFFLACPEKKCQAAIVHAHCDKRSKLPQRSEPVSPPSGKESSSGGMALRADLGRYFVTMPFSMLMLFYAFCIRKCWCSTLHSRGNHRSGHLRT